MAFPLNRRQLLGAGLAAAIPSAHAFIPVKVPQKWDDTVDVLCVGTGFSGLAAAIEAHNAGASVLVIDKMALPGGNSILAAGGFAAPGNDMQKKAGIKDSPELLLADMLRAGGHLNHVECAKVVAYGAYDTYRWATDYLGVKWDRLGFQGGHSVARSCSFMNGTGADIIGPMLTKLSTLKVPVRLRTKLLNFVTDDNGAVIGVEVRANYQFPKEETGETKFIRVKRGVVLATGGFSQNVQMRTMHDPRLTTALDSTNSPAATGEGLQAAQRVGAGTCLMDWIQLGPWTSPDEKGFGVCPKFVEASVGYGLMIDPKTGKRFINETGNRKVRADAILAIGHPAIILISETNMKKHVPMSTVKAGLDNGSIKRFASLEELAQNYGIDPKLLKESVDRWNDAIAKKTDPDFKAKIFDDTEANEGTFFACRLWPRVHYCMGGLTINAKAEVIDTDFNILPGLFAAGEVCGGVHGMVRLGTVSIADCIVYGRVAGKAAANRKA